MRTPSWIPAALLAFALVPLGSAPTRAEYALVVATAATFLALAFRGARRRGFFAYGEDLLGGVSLPVLLALPLLVFSQTIAAIFTGYTAGAPSEMLRSGLGLYALILFYLLAYHAIDDYTALRRVLALVVLVGAAEAAYGVFNLLGGNERLLVYRRWAYHDSATGTLVNRNHFALLMALTFPLATVNAGLGGRSVGQKGSRDSEDVARRTLLALASVLTALALLLSRSRMGLFSFVVACAAVLPLARLLQPQPRPHAGSRRVRWAIPLLCISLGVAYVAVIGVTPVFERFATVRTDFQNGRLPIWRAALEMALDRPLFGHGWGSFDFVIDGYLLHPTGLDTSYAHNEYLQVFAEAGISGVLLVFWMLALFGGRVVRALSCPIAPEARFTLIWLAVGIVTALFHSLADFGLRIPGVAFMFTLVLAMFVRVSEQPEIVAPRRASSPARQSSAGKTE